MTNEERDLISQFVQRVGGPPQSSGGFAGSVPTTGTPPLPPVDPEADSLLAELFTRFPEARYRLTQFAFVQEHAVAAATNQIAQLRAQMQQMQAQMQAQMQSQAQQPSAPTQSSPWGNQGGQQQPQPQPSRGLFGGLFGGGQQAPQPQYQPQYQQPIQAPPQQYAPGYQPGMFQRSGSGFLGSALTTAAGVAGGMVAANALEGLFSGRHEASAASFGGGGAASQQNFPGEASPWASPSGGGADPMDQGGDAKSYGAPDQSAWNSTPAPDTGWQDAAAPAPDTGWQDASAAPDDSGWSDAGGSDVDNT